MLAFELVWPRTVPLMKDRLLMNKKLVSLEREKGLESRWAGEIKICNGLIRAKQKKETETFKITFQREFRLTANLSKSAIIEMALWGHFSRISIAKDTPNTRLQRS